MFHNATLKIRSFVLTGLVAAVASVGLWQTDLLVTRGFGKALEGAKPTLTFAHESTQTGANIAGDEGYWLTRADVESQAPFGKPVALGDRISIAGRDGRARHLEVIDLKTIGTAPVKTGAAETRLLAVTLRPLGEANGQGVVRFIVEDQGVGPERAAPAKTL